MIRRVPPAVRWAVAAVVGLALAATLTSAAAHLSSQHIGLSSEPLAAGRQLVARPAPGRSPSPAPTRSPSPTAAPSPHPTATATAAPPTIGGEGEGGDD